MTYKTYKIINKTTNQSQNYIGFVLDGNIEFRNGEQDSIFCVNEYPFITYQIGDKIEVNLTNAKRFNTNNYHQEIVRTTTSRNAPINDYNNQQQDEEQRQLQQLQAQKQQSLNKMKLGLDTFYNVLEPLEEYIEKSGDFPSFIDRRQVYRKNIQDSEGPLEVDEDLFLSNLFIFARTFHGKPRSFMKVIQEDFYKWINAVGITAKNCPEVLKHFLIEINNILEGNDEKIVRETRERNEKVEINPWDMPKIFAGLQEPLRKNREQAKALKGKSWNELPKEDRLKGDADLGKQSFEEVKRSVSIPHENFRLRYFGEKRLSESVSSFQKGDDMEVDFRLEVPAKDNVGQLQKSNDEDIGVAGILTIIGISVLLISGVVVVKRQLNKKVKKISS